MDFVIGTYVAQVDVGGFKGEVQFTEPSAGKFNWKVDSFSGSGLNKIEIKSIPLFFA